MFAGVLNQDGEGARHLTEVCSKRTHIVPVNVTKEESVADAVQFVKKNLPAKGSVRIYRLFYLYMIFCSRNSRLLQSEKSSCYVSYYKYMAKVL